MAADEWNSKLRWIADSSKAHYHLCMCMCVSMWRRITRIFWTICLQNACSFFVSLSMPLYVCTYLHRDINTVSLQTHTHTHTQSQSVSSCVLWLWISSEIQCPWEMKAWKSSYLQWPLTLCLDVSVPARVWAHKCVQQFAASVQQETWLLSTYMCLCAYMLLLMR